MTNSFFFTTIFILLLMVMLICSIISRYDEFKHNNKRINETYTDEAILKMAAKEQTNIYFSFGKIFIPIGILLDVIVNYLIN